MTHPHSSTSRLYNPPADAGPRVMLREAGSAAAVTHPPVPDGRTAPPVTRAYATAGGGAAPTRSPAFRHRSPTPPPFRRHSGAPPPSPRRPRRRPGRGGGQGTDPGAGRGCAPTGDAARPGIFAPRAGGRGSQRGPAPARRRRCPPACCKLVPRSAGGRLPPGRAGGCRWGDAPRGVMPSAAAW